MVRSTVRLWRKNNEPKRQGHEEPSDECRRRPTTARRSRAGKRVTRRAAARLSGRCHARKWAQAGTPRRKAMKSAGGQGRSCQDFVSQSETGGPRGCKSRCAKNVSSVIGQPNHSGGQVLGLRRPSRSLAMGRNPQAQAAVSNLQPCTTAQRSQQAKSEWGAAQRAASCRRERATSQGDRQQRPGCWPSW